VRIFTTRGKSACANVMQDKTSIAHLVAFAPWYTFSQIDMAIENVFNMGFYFILVSICLGVVGIDPWAVFASVSSILLAFAFVFGASAASYFSGMLLIVVQKPYGVG